MVPQGQEPQAQPGTLHSMLQLVLHGVAFSKGCSGPLQFCAACVAAPWESTVGASFPYTASQGVMGAATPNTLRLCPTVTQTHKGGKACDKCLQMLSRAAECWWCICVGCLRQECPAFWDAYQLPGVDYGSWLNCIWS